MVYLHGKEEFQIKTKDPKACRLWGLILRSTKING